MNSLSGFSDFIKDSHIIKIQLQIDEEPCKASSSSRIEDKVRRKICTPPFYTVELPSVFSHMSLLLMETLSATQHGEFVTRSKQGKYETMVELVGHISYRYTLIDTPQPEGMGILDSTSPLTLDPLRYLI